MLFAQAPAEYDIIIIGSGPAGLSAAAHAKKLNARHVLLEAKSYLADTIFKFQKGKHVMAEPSIIPLRSDLPFGAGLREKVLDNWKKGITDNQVNVAFGKSVTHIQKDEQEQVFTVQCEDGSSFTSRAVILGIGLQGNLRKLGVAGENLSNVQYTLTDPDEYKNETIIVVGAGDAGIENALALMPQNKVVIMNRQSEFAMCKEGNRGLITNAEKAGRIQVCYSANTVKVEETGSEPPLSFTYSGVDGEVSIPCHRVIARLGAIPPRKLVESFGVVFPNQNPSSVPVLSEKYESNVSGLFIVGALGGYPLIKQAMNQGYEVVESILGREIEPVDEPLLKEKIKKWKAKFGASEALDLILGRVSLFREMSKLQLREFVLESQILTPKENEIVFKKLDYTNTFFSIVEGEVKVEIEKEDGSRSYITLKEGAFFGEMGLISGRRRTATIIAGKNCALLETPRTAMLRLIASVDAVRQQIDQAFLRNAIYTYIGPMLDANTVNQLIENGVEKKLYKTNQILFSDGDAADGLYLIRSGSVAVSKIIKNSSHILSYVSAGNYVGEMALVNDTTRSATVTATTVTEVLILKADNFKEQLRLNPAWQASIKKIMADRLRSNIAQEDEGSKSTDVIQFMLNQGLGGASDVLLINQSLCTQCNNCETACAETHNGVSRLKREAGPSYANFHLPIACRHCENPSCMKECPPDAIRRGKDGEVTISDACIGCGNCERNCPYGVIQMAVQKPPQKGGNLMWLLFGVGKAPGERAPEYDPDAQKKAVKCDLCKGQDGGPACVRACPTGAANRMAPEQILKPIQFAD
jgi:CRP-like cAMP-binding protein/Fe-S-cluster-containing hydrogenase component 2/thioredoxin reductase